MARIKRYCGSYILEVDGNRIKEYCGQYIYEIEGYLNQTQLLAVLATLFAYR